MITMIIKGDLVAAALAASGRGIKMKRIDQAPGSVVGAGRDEDWEKIARWFNEEPGQAPYPAGTLLFFSQRKEG